MSMRLRLMGACLMLSVWGAAPLHAQPAPVSIAEALQASSRSSDNVKLDAGRKPADVLNFIGLQPGMRAIDMFGANRYWSEIMAPVVGQAGHVTVWQPRQFLNEARQKEFADFAARQGNVTLLTSPFEQPLLGTEAYDALIMNLDYHDVYWQNAERKIPQMSPDAWLAQLFKAMKPGAVLGIIDHAANPGSDTREVVEKYHRIDPAVVRADFERAGFTFEGSSDLLRNPADDHLTNVFDPKVRGQTDRFLFKFRKPAA
ncbi:class I SAM-dependent methyltransferase [Sphingomonas piscis]|uniref:Class I SAM-dependent methyltransferase n=1 Tax=Sphingomonas piscis TaxID=2714943 RepID=A0A6G7YMG4_9SPHN|nr:class I SAM-dependent methyltransferase [Sphingomonas piscis]QIK77933.1 class I SAM-dependent methyltransferase [Sphingomonas piscis]